MKLILTTPSGLKIKEEVDSFYFPSIDGEVGILKDHANYISLVGIGKSHYTKGNKDFSFVVNSGILEVSNNNITVAADDVLFADEINKNEATKKSADFSKRLESLNLYDKEYSHLKKCLKWEEEKSKLLT